MKIIFFSILAVVMIGMMVPSAFAEDTISINEFSEIYRDMGYEHGMDVWINGHVKFENGKALGLGIDSGQQVTIQVFTSDDKLVYTDSKRNSSLKELPNSSWDISAFQFLIPNEKFGNSDRYSVYVFYGPPNNNFKNTQFSGKTEIFVGIDRFAFQEKMNREQQLQAQTSTPSASPSQKTSTPSMTTSQNSDSIILILVVIFIIIIGFFIRIISKRKRSEITRFGISEKDLRNNFYNLDDEEAEELVGKLFEEKGYSVQVGVMSKTGKMKKVGDHGIDVRAKIKEKKKWYRSESEYVGIQVKHWKDNVGFDDAAKTMGVSEEFDKVILISTKSDFTKQLIDYMKEGHWKKLELWNSDEFKDELRRYVLNTKTAYKR